MWTLTDIEDKLKKGTIRGYTVINTKKVEKKKSKYGNEKTEVDGILFDSKKEAKRYGELKILLKAGEIGLLEMQKKYDLEVNGKKVAAYVADFVYLTKEGLQVAEDVKSVSTRKNRIYRLKVKLMKTIYGITITEV